MEEREQNDVGCGRGRMEKWEENVVVWREERSGEKVLVEELSGV